MLTDLQRRAIPKCAPDECHYAASFPEAVYFAQLELDLIDEGQEAAACYTKRQVASLRKFVRNNLASLHAMHS